MRSILKYFRFIFSKKSRVKAVPDHDFKLYLDSLNVLEGVKRGDFNCSYCGANINLDNIQAVFPVEGRGFGFLCEKAVCVSGIND